MRRILFDNINEIRTQRTFLGAIFGYNTIICDTGSQLGIGEDSMSVSVGATGGGTVSESGSVETQVTKSLIRRMFAFPHTSVPGKSIYLIKILIFLYHKLEID